MVAGLLSQMILSPSEVIGMRCLFGMELSVSESDIAQWMLFVDEWKVTPSATTSISVPLPRESGERGCGREKLPRRRLRFLQCCVTTAPLP